MLKIRQIGILFCVGAFLSACSDFIDYENFDDSGCGNSFWCDDKVNTGADMTTNQISEPENTGPYEKTGGINNGNCHVSNVNSNAYDFAPVNVSGVKYCPQHKRCMQQRVPPQSCVQPMPTYYDNVPTEHLDDAIVLIHPYTRAQAVCPFVGGDSAIACAQAYRQKGYVLITDLPQVPAQYDYLHKGTYPTRKWRNGGEVVPRW